MEPAAQRLSGMSEYDFAQWFFKGFRALVAGDAAMRPFAEIRTGQRLRDDITDDLAAVYFALDPETQMAFLAGLDTAFRRLDVRKVDDQRALIFVLRLAAKVQHAQLLPHLTKKLFAEQEGEPSDTKKLRSVALDVAIELSAISPNAKQSLQSIVHSKLFRSSAAATILLALCEASPRELLDHLYRLESDLVKIYGEATNPADRATRLRRARLLSDLTTYSDDTIIGGVIEFALRNRSWALAWLGDTLLDRGLIDSLSTTDSSKATQLLDTVRTLTLDPVAEPDWVRQLVPQRKTTGERKEDIVTLTSDEVGSVAEETLFESMVARLLSSDHSFSHLSADVRQLVLDDVDGKE